MISLILTVFNEGDSIRGVLDSIQVQSRLPDEIVVVDAGSTDDTVRILEAYQTQLPLKIIIEPGCNISRGRNIAIDYAQGEIIAVTDAGTRLDINWLQVITQPLLDNPKCNVVAGFFHADPQTAFEVAMGATVLPLVDEIDPQTFLPSSRSVAARKTAIQEIQGYPEWLDYCEDLVFDLRLKAMNPPFHFAPDAIVHFRPRSSFSSYFRQYYLYARGDGKANLWGKRHLIRYLTYFVAIPLIFVLGFHINPVFWLLFVVGGVAYLGQCYQRLSVIMQRYENQSPWAWIQAIALIPVIRIVGDVAKMIGYPIGRWWRLQNQPPNWKL